MSAQDKQSDKNQRYSNLKELNGSCYVDVDATADEKLSNIGVWLSCVRDAISHTSSELCEADLKCVYKAATLNAAEIALDELEGVNPTV